MNNKETTIEKIVRENTPDFIIGTSFYVDKYHSYKLWNCPVKFKKGKYVQKYYLNSEGILELKKYDIAMPDFVLNNNKQMKTLERVIYSADNGLPYKNPFFRKTGWYIECFGDYWHSEDIVGLSKEEHEKQVQEAYEESGNHVLILWETDIKNHWNEYCLPKINEYIEEFKQENEIKFEFSLKEENPLSDISLNCLNQDYFYLSLSQNDKDKVLNELVDKFSNLKPLYEPYNIKSDWLKWKDKCDNEKIMNACYAGNKLLNYFIRSRFDSFVHKNRTLNQVWKDKKLMRECIDWQLSNETGVEHSNRIFAAMQNKTNFRFPSNLHHAYVYMRCKKYAKKGGIFFDPCAGWGGRMLGAYALGMKYVAIDANKQLVKELKELANYINYDAEIYYGDSSDKDFVNKILKGRKIDLVFTCPPYYNEEHYSDDEFQSDVMYHDKKEWHEKFLQYMIDGVRDNLKEDGCFIISCDEKINWNYIKNVNINNLAYFGFNHRREDAYYLLGNYNELENDDYVKCSICGKCMRHLANHITKMHSMTLEDYKLKYPNSPIGSKSFIESRINANKTKFKGEKKKYNKRFVYLMPDGSYASKADKYKRAWNVNEIKEEHIIDATTIDYVPAYAEDIVNGIEGEDYVVCAICGEKKGALTQHLRKVHNMTKEEYIENYNKPIYSEKNKKSFHECTNNKWKTQFESVKYKRKELNSKKDKKIIEKEFIEQKFKEGYSVGEIAKECNVSEYILSKYIKQYNLNTPSVTLLHIRRTVRNGAQYNLENYSLEELKEIIKKEGKENTRNLFGVKRNVFDTWLKIIK